MRSYKILKSEHIVKLKDYQAVMKQGVRFISRYYVILAIPSGYRRVGFIVSKKVGGSVQRHRVKRRMRECYRHLPDMMIPSKAQAWMDRKWPSIDMVIIARKSIIEASYQHMAGDLLEGMMSVNSKASRLRHLNSRYTQHPLKSLMVSEKTH